MGTSTSHPSPNTPSWRIARQVLGRDAAPLARQSEEIWKAAAADRGGRLGSELASPILAAAGAVAAQATSPLDAVRAFNRIAAEQRESGLALEIGRRALMRAVVSGGGASAFGAELFAEAASYYASRDLSSYVGAAGRVATSSESIALKDGLRAIAREAAGEVRVRTDSDGWSAFVRGTLQILTRAAPGRGAATDAGPHGGAGR
ncbi:MAG: hypothetical protein M3Z05_22785 [Gemmatimonadota bacterium]|nr:hypothetical protein [Gemmatimonadota bacterium]